MAKQYRASKRGNMMVELDGKEVKLRPSFSAACEFEETAGVGVYEALSGLQSNKINSKIIVSAIWAGIRGAKPGREEQCPTWTEVGEMVFDKGMAECIGDALKFLTLCLAGSEGAEEVLNSPGKSEKSSNEEDDG